ncbi:MAG: hypothetical protein Q7W51_04530 [Coriobacteriia bacterium]|nr:hypothetical protein [Coriobacteriia bacterium]
MKLRPLHLLIAFTIAAIAMTAVVTGGSQPGSLATEGDTITMTVSRTEPNATAVFDITLLEGGDAAHESSHIFQSLESAPGVATLAFDTQALTLTVAFDASIVSADSLRQQLAASGYVTQSIADAAETQLTADGTGRSIHLVPGEVLEPSFFKTPAGVPLTITFSAGQGHLATVSIPALGITQDITAEGASLTIPAPVAGTYELVCAEGYADATLVVE